MHLLLITNLFPPQELGGYGRCMADYAWGLEQRGHQLTVLCSDAPYLPQPASDLALQAKVFRNLELKGNFKSGVHHITDPHERAAINERNRLALRTHTNNQVFEGVLLGNLDLLGADLVTELLQTDLPILHHIGFVAPPFAPEVQPKNARYQMVAASQAVRNALLPLGLEQPEDIPVVYPGVRCDIFSNPSSRALPAPLGPELTTPHALGSAARPLKLCCAGLLMSTKGIHTVAQALVHLKEGGHHVELSLAGGEFQEGYSQAIRAFLSEHGLAEHVTWHGQLSRPQLARFFRLHHAAVFPSIHPEAFGIVAAEAMASGLVLISSGAGGAAELLEHGVNGLRFQAGDPASLARSLEALIHSTPERLRLIAQKGLDQVQQHFSVSKAAAQLEGLFQDAPRRPSKLWNRGHITL